jgi:hypothetical protein
MIDSKLEDVKIDLQDYAKKSPEEKAEMIAAARKSADEWYQLRKDDRKLTHDQLIEAAQEWKRNGRIFGAKSLVFTELPKKDKKDNTFLVSVNKYDWVEERHILSAATASDIPLLLEVKAALCARLSEETLFEIRRLNKVIQRLGRSRYRKVIGLTEKVE